MFVNQIKISLMKIYRAVATFLQNISRVCACWHVDLPVATYRPCSLQQSVDGPLGTQPFE